MTQEPGYTEQKTEAPNSVMGRSYISKNKKGISDIGFFMELKNRHIIQSLPVASKLLGWRPVSFPLLIKLN